MIGPFKLLASFTALMLVVLLLVALSAGSAEAGPDHGLSGAPPGIGGSPELHEWAMVLLLFGLVIAYRHIRSAHRRRA
jgi:hypothetical protein